MMRVFNKEKTTMVEGIVENSKVTLKLYRKNIGDCAIIKADWSYCTMVAEREYSLSNGVINLTKYAKELLAEYTMAIRVNDIDEVWE